MIWYTGGTIDLNDLSVEQLQQLRTSLNDEVQVLTSNMTNLRGAINRFTTSSQSLDVFNERNQDQQIFIPLTSSMYIPGKLANIRNVLVDVGTGYYVEKPIPDAKKYIDTKITYLGDNIDNIANIALQKRRDLETVTVLLQTKLSNIRQREQQKLDSIGKIQ
jgi:prefoldin alpha subunit